MDFQVDTCGFATREGNTLAQFIYEISPLIYVFFPIPIMGKSTGCLIAKIKK